MDPIYGEAFKKIKKFVLSASALVLTDVTEPFTLYLDKRAEIVR